MNEAILTLIILTFCTISVIVYIFKFKPLNNTKVKDLYAEGLDLMITGRRRSAYKNFKEIINKDSENIKAYLRLGQVLREGGSPIQAIKVHRGLIHRQNLSYYEKIEVHKNLALDYYQAGNLDHAINELQTLLKIEKNNDWALSQLSNYYCDQQDWKNSGYYFEKYQKITNKQDTHKLALYKIQEGRLLIQEKQFTEARKKFENAININSNIAVAYYFIGNSFSSESEEAYQKSVDINETEEKNVHMNRAKSLLGKAIPMWIRYAELKPEQAWMVIHLLKDGLFALDRYSEFEDILKQILKNDPDNIEVIASLSEIYSHRGEENEALDVIDSALEQDSSSLIVKLIKLKLEAKSEKGGVAFLRSLDDIIHFLVTDERFQVYKNTATDKDVLWLYKTSGEKEAKV